MPLAVRRNLVPALVVFEVMRLGEAKARSPLTYIRGEKHHKAKLTQELVLQIREAWRLGLLSQRQLAERFGLCKKSIWKVVHRKTWWHV